jgi:hypothetical protein
MASLGQGSPLENITTNTTQATEAPSYYTNYLSNLATAGNAATGMDPSKMVAGFTDLQNAGFSAIPTAATGYQPQLTAAEQTAGTAAKGVGAEQINNFMSPYTSNVVDEMARLQQQNVQRNLMPALKGAFVGTGGLGGQRYANALGQTAADLQANLTGQQTGALQKGYSDAVTAALQNAQLQNQAATTQGNLAGQEQTLGLAGSKAMLDAGAQQQALEQAKIEAPLKTATNAAGLLRGYTVPTATTQKYTGPIPGAYSASPLQQIAGLGALFASTGQGGKSAVTGVTDFLKGLPGTSTPANPADTTGGTRSLGGNTSNVLDLGGGLTIDANGNLVGGTDIAPSPTTGVGSGNWQYDPDTGTWYEA